MVQATRYLYVVQDDEILHGEPIIQGTRTPVIAIVALFRAFAIIAEIAKGNTS